MAPITFRAARILTRLCRSVLVGAVAALTVPLSVAPVQADQPSPDSDPFYSVPADVSSYGNGTLLGARPISLFGLPVPVSAWQIRYRTTDSTGKAIADVATVLVPQGEWNGPGARPVLAYQMPEDSLGTACAPSYALSGGGGAALANALPDVPYIGTALLRGWSLVLSDYEGPQSRFLDGLTEGRGVLDGIRAARSFGPSGIGPASPLGMWGYSGGAFATLWAAQLRASYAPDVVPVGLTAGGVPADVAELAAHVDGGGQAGLSLLILLAMIRQEQQTGLAELLNPKGQALQADSAGACGTDLVLAHPRAHADDYATAPGVLTSPQFLAAAERNRLGNIRIDVPAYLYHSTTDDTVPVDGFSAMVDRYCAQGVALTAVHSSWPSHNGAAIGEAGGAMKFLADRFAGVPAPTGCNVT
ncbi:lipase family protein [Nocardia stercoris]|uniref:Lipase n=1 Tax=Nocardia stercoris TaxID=2483361 RepID=A0A3M2KVN3_9NOCA|nr:lipase family protein [Nocardia stercoris]RMI29682.1 lipase [Nocardia stercoris]